MNIVKYSQKMRRHTITYTYGSDNYDYEGVRDVDFKRLGLNLIKLYVVPDEKKVTIVIRGNHRDRLIAAELIRRFDPDWCRPLIKQLG